MKGGDFINDTKKIHEKIIVQCRSCSSKFFMGKLKEEEMWRYAFLPYR